MALLMPLSKGGVHSSASTRSSLVPDKCPKRYVRRGPPRMCVTIGSNKVSETQDDLAITIPPPDLPYGCSLLQGPRDTMEDQLMVGNAPLGFLYAGVYDGHGGTHSCEWLQRELYQAVCDAMDSSFLNGLTTVLDDKIGLECPVEVTKKLAAVFSSVDQELLKYLKGVKDTTEDLSASGSTATVCLVSRDKVISASVGDSQAVLCRSGVAINLTTPHRIYGVADGVLEEVQRVEATGAWVHDGRVCGLLAVSRAFGDWEFKGEGLKKLLQDGVDKEMWTPDFAATKQFRSDPVISTPDVTEINLREQDEFLIVATDGLWDCMPAPEAVRWARQEFKKGKSPQVVAEGLAEITLKRYTTDNVGIVVVDLRNPNVEKKKKEKKFRLFG